MYKSTRVEWISILCVLIGCLVVIVATGYAAFQTRPCTEAKCLDFEEWLDQDDSVKSVLVGAAAGATFGLIDNTLLWVGMNSMESLFRLFPRGDEPNFLAGYGNAFSSIVSAFISVFVGRWISNVFNVDVDRSPLWSMAMGILFGCVIGIVLPSMFVYRIDTSEKK